MVLAKCCRRPYLFHQVLVWHIVAQGNLSWRLLGCNFCRVTIKLSLLLMWGDVVSGLQFLWPVHQQFLTLETQRGTVSCIVKMFLHLLPKSTCHDVQRRSLCLFQNVFFLCNTGTGENHLLCFETLLHVFHQITWCEMQRGRHYLPCCEMFLCPCTKTLIGRHNEGNCVFSTNHCLCFLCVTKWCRGERKSMKNCKTAMIGGQTVKREYWKFSGSHSNWRVLKDIWFSWNAQQCVLCSKGTVICRRLWELSS